MLLIMEIWLTIVAWNKGWKAVALLPMLAVLGISFFIGVVCGVNETEYEKVLGLCLALDVAAIVSLAVMCIRGR